MATILDEILTQKRRAVELARSVAPMAALERAAAKAPPPRGFLSALKAADARGDAAVIAEAKKASPSASVIRPNYDPAGLAKAYAEGGAACLSVLTDAPFFQGSLDHLKAASAAVPIPILRKDFFIDPYQVVEARAAGADAILVIMAAVDDGVAQTLLAEADRFGMDVLVEVHDAPEMLRANVLGGPLVGVNNRDLATFETKLETTKNLAPLAAEDAFLVSESGVKTPDDVRTLHAMGARAFLVGESVSGAADPAGAVRALVEARRAR